MPQTITKTFQRWMGEEKIGLFAHAFLYCLSIVYGAAVRLRLVLYNAGVLKTKKLPCKVVSVGNITAGGSGKTPMTMHIALTLKKMGLRVVILTRGYRRAGRGYAVVSDGERTFLGPEEAGDEPYLMAQRLSHIPVIVGKDRVKSGRRAVSNFSPDVIVLDDGFQHIRLFRDLNILLVDSRRGFGNSFLLPRGILREPVSALERADLVMVKVDGPPYEPPEGPFVRELKKPVMRFSYRTKGVLDINDNVEREPGYLSSKRVVALSGIAEPASFLETLEEAGAVIVNTLIYPDHHRYTPSDIERIVEEARLADADLVATTEKDAVKLGQYEKSFSGIMITALSIDVVTEDLSGLLGERLGTLQSK
jgi:tetraacyldisaccharide 4'-kinase